MRVIIHPGLTKTGTTAIQHFLDKNSEKLTGLGFYYPKIEEIKFENYRSSGNGYGLYLKVVAESINPALLREAVSNWIGSQCQCAESKGCNNVIISSEALCTLSEDNLKLLISSLPRNGISYKFIIFRREPYAWFFSSWLQTVKREGQDKWLDKSLFDDIDFSLRPLLAENIIRANGFDNSVHVLDYDLSKTHTVEAFLKEIDIKEESYNELDFFTEANRVVNRSLSRREFIIHYWVNKLSRRNVELSEALHSLIIDNNISPTFFFLDTKVKDLIYEYCAIKGISINEANNRIMSNEKWGGVLEGALKLFGIKQDKPTEEINSEEEFFALLSDSERHFLTSINVIIKFYISLFNKTRELVIHKINLYNSSKYKNLMPEGFNAFVYLTLNDDVLYSHIDPYKHYYEFGMLDQRVFSENMLISPAEVSWP